MLFPIIGPTKFSDDFGIVRPGGHEHKGIDIFAPRWALIVAVESGMLKRAPNPLGGNAWLLHGDSGTTCYYAHLQEYVGDRRMVWAGELIGYVGNTGNAAHTSTHCHFELHRNGVPIDPYPMLMTAVHLEQPVASPVAHPPSTGPVARGGRGGAVTAGLAFAALAGLVWFGRK